MLLTITTTHQPVRETNYILHKHPNRCQHTPASFGQLHVLYAQASTQGFKAARLLNINLVKLVQRRGRTLALNQAEEKHDQEEAAAKKSPCFYQPWLRLFYNQWKRLQLIQDELTCYDKCLKSYKNIVVIKEIKHLNWWQFPIFEGVFEFTQSKIMNLPAGKLRYEDHHFEWTPEKFQAWAKQVTKSFSYIVKFQLVGLKDPQVNSLIQIDVFNHSKIKNQFLLISAQY